MRVGIRSRREILYVLFNLTLCHSWHALFSKIMGKDSWVIVHAIAVPRVTCDNSKAEEFRSVHLILL